MIRPASHSSVGPPVHADNAATARPLHAVRPPSAGPAVPAGLVLPVLALPGPDDTGRTLKRLGPPPAAGSRAATRDIAITRALVSRRTAEGDAWARTMDAHGGTVIWRELAAHVSGHEAVAQPLVGAALAAASTQAGIGKRLWQRPRPFAVDPAISVIGRRPKDSSYPSGHAARAFAAARVVAALDPSLGDAAYELAREVAFSRIYAGVHFASDVVAGARLGIALGDSVLGRWRAGKLDAVLGAQGVQAA